MSAALPYCRRNLAEIGAPPSYCNKPVGSKNGLSLNWCGSCRSRLPFWPMEDGAVVLRAGEFDEFRTVTLPPIIQELPL